MAERVECEICLEECKKDELEAHRETCMARLMFRCTICDGDYVSKEGLWNHLDLHEIADESKELHYQEIRTTYKLHLCAQCNDQRGYRENLFWKHVHDEHDNFVVQYTECGENFRTPKIKTDLDFTTHCKAEEQTIAGDLEADQRNKDLPRKVENTVSLDSCGEMNETIAPQLEPSQEQLHNVLLEGSKCSEINILDGKGTLVTKNIHEGSDINSRLSECLTKNSNVGGDAENNLTTKECQVVSITSRSETQAPLVENPSDGTSDTNEICGHKFKKSSVVNVHIRRVHHIEGNLRNIQADLMTHNQQEQNQAEQISLKKEIVEVESTLLQHDDFAISPANQSTVIDWLDFGQHPRDVKIKHSEPPSVDFRAQEPVLTQEKKLDLLEEFVHTRLGPDADSLLNAHSSADSNVADGMNVNMTEKESMVKAERKNVQQFVENQLNETSKAKCSHCGKEFSSVVILSRHIEISHQSHPCGITLSNFHQARRHKRMKHTESKHKCPCCSKKFHNNGNYQKHLSVCMTWRIPCELCGLKFKNVYSVNNHKKRIHHVDKGFRNAQIDQKSCSQERVAINSEQSLENCSRRCEATHPFDENPSSALSDTKCSHCGKQCFSVKSLSYHIDTCYKPTTCNICGKVFPNRGSANHHKKMKHMEPKYKCANCSLKFHCKNKLQKHLPICNKKQIPCKICGRMLRHLASVNNHLRKVHHIEGDLKEFLTSRKSRKQHQQDDCGQSIITDCPGSSQHAAVQEAVDPKPSSIHFGGQHSASTLAKRTDAHKEIESLNLTSFDREKVDSPLIEHSPTNPHSTYDTNYVTKKKPKRHPISSRQGSSKTKAMTEKILQPFVENTSDTKCTNCGKELSNVCALALHIERNHVPHICDVCGVTFPSVLKAQYHKKTKHTEAKYLCPHCPKQFHFERNYREHLPRCGSKKFECELCDQQFKSSGFVARHMRNVHKMYGAPKNVVINRRDCSEEHEQNHAEKIGLKKEISVGETTSNPLIVIGCPICGENLSDKSQLSRHVEVIHQMTICTSCGMAFDTVEQLSDHKICCPQHIEHVKSQFSSKKILPLRSETSIALAVKDCISITHTLKEYQTADCNELKQEPEPCDDVYSIQGENMQLKMEIQEEETTLQEQEYGANLIQDENMELKMEIQMEDTTLQEEEHQAPDEDRGELPTISSASQQKIHKPKFSCTKCHQTFNGMRAFQVHVKEHATKNDRKCTICGRIFENRYILANHKRTAHTELQRKCSHCPKMFNLISSLRRHEKSHSKILERKGSLVCNLCPERFLDESGLQRHISKVHPSSEMTCDQCDLKFTKYSKLIYHVKTFHTEGFKCPDCGKIFYCQPQVRRHMTIHLKAKQKKMRDSPEVFEQQIDDDLEQNQISSLQNVEYERLDHEKEIEIKKDQPEACSICELIIFGDMKNHKHAAHNEPKYKCSHCPKMYPSMYKLKRHETTHIKENVECKLCLKTFRDKYRLQHHLNFAHPGSELPCGMCDLKFATHHKLLYHKNTIHKPQRFKCPECDKQFHAQYLLRNHMYACPFLVN